MVAIVLIAIIYFPIFVFLTSPVWLIMGFLGVGLVAIIAIALILYVLLFVLLFVGGGA
jgi:hypothetical protein